MTFFLTLSHLMLSTLSYADDKSFFPLLLQFYFVLPPSIPYSFSYLPLFSPLSLPYLYAVAFLFHPFLFPLSAAPPSCLITHGSCLKKRGTEGRGQMGGETGSQKKEWVIETEAAGLSVRHMASEWEIFASSQRELLVPLSPLSVVGLLLRKDLVWILLLLLLFFSFYSLSPLLPSFLCLAEGLQLSAFPKSLTSHSPFTPLSPGFPPQDVVWGGSAPQREAAGLGGKSKCV